jgi:carbon-monoxide dehydrogenase small subunit
MKINLKINDKEKTFEINPGDLLLDVLRREGYYGVKAGCYSGNCGACVVLLNNKPVNSCLILAANVNGMEITTIEGIGTLDNPHPIQKSFVEKGAVQCGYCTPGMILSTKALLEENKNPSEDEIKIALNGNLCRCTGYVKIIDAVKDAAKKIK